MPRTLLGIDIGYDRLKLALVTGRSVKKTVSVPMPASLVKEGRVVSLETMGEFIRDTMKENRISASRAALVLSNETVFVRSVSMPQMTADQLAYNLPYEFRDYITDELKNYSFDYAMLSTPEDLKPVPSEKEDEEPTLPPMELMAVAVPTSLLTESKAMLRKAGLRLSVAAPTVSAYINLIRGLDEDARSPNGEYCIIDLGYNAIRMYMFAGERHMVTRVLEVGLSSIDDVLAGEYNVDVHLAHTYLLTNHDGCQTREQAMNAWSNISVELMRAMNFYRFSNPSSQLGDVWLCGGGAAIPALRRAISDALDMNIHDGAELVHGGDAIEDCNTMVQAIGIAQET